MHDNLVIFRFSFENTRSESPEAEQRARRTVCERDIFAEKAVVSLPFFEIKNSILSVTRYTRGIVYLVTHRLPGRRISLQYVNVRRVAKS